MRIIQNELGEELGRHRPQLLHSGGTGMMTQPSSAKRIGIYQMRHCEGMAVGSGRGGRLDDSSLRLKMAHQQLGETVRGGLIFRQPFLD